MQLDLTAEKAATIVPLVVRFYRSMARVRQLERDLTFLLDNLRSGARRPLATRCARDEELLLIALRRGPSYAQHPAGQMMGPGQTPPSTDAARDRVSIARNEERQFTAGV